MKTTIYSILAAAACGMAFGQTAYTTPVGYVTIDVPALSDTTIVPPLERPTLHSAASTSIAGNVVGAAGLSAGAFATGAGCYLQVTSGALAGQRFTITANDATTITVSSSPDLETLGFVGTGLTPDTFKVVPFWTLNTLFPEGAGVGTTADALNPTSFVFASSTASGVNKSSAKAYIYCTGDVENELPAGWYDNDDVFAGALAEADTRIDLSRMYSIRTSSGVDLTVTVTGQVPNVASVIPVAVDTVSSDVLTGTVYPLDLALADTGLQSALQASTDALNPIELLFVYDDNGAGVNKAASKAYFYCSGDVENELPAGWYDNDDVFAGPVPSIDKQIKAGRGIVIRKAPYGSAGNIPWTAPVPYPVP
jgi:uncharacterized protein (TIGR02597 family)